MNNDHGTTIGPRTRIHGHVQGDEDLTILGRVDGNITGNQTLVVEASGVVVAETIQVGRALISGTVVGSISAVDLIHISEEGRVVGDLRAPRIILAEGACFRGNVDMGPVELAAAPRPTAPRGTERPARGAVEERPARSGVEERPAAEPTSESRPAPRPARPPRKVERTPATPAPKAAPAPAPVAVAPRAAVVPRSAGTLESKASAAALAVARAVKKDAPRPVTPALKPTTSKVPKPPTTAGRKTRVKRK